MEKENNELKPCPFCGGEAELVKEHFFGEDHYAGRCGSCAATSTFKTTKKEATAEWNRRANSEIPNNCEATQVESCQIGAKYEFSNDNKEWVRRVYLGRLSILDTGVMTFLTTPISEPITGYCLPNGFLWTKAKKVKRFTYMRKIQE